LDALHVSLLSSAQGTAVFLLSMLTAWRKKPLNKTYLLSVLGSLAVIVNLVIVSVARAVWLLYIGKMILILILSLVYCWSFFIFIAVCIGSLFFIVMPLLRTKLTGLIEMNEYAIVFIGAGVVETVGHSIMDVIGNSIYKASINFFPGLVFLVFALTGFIPIAMMGYIQLCFYIFSCPFFF
jgi:hypothetical protein